MTSEEAIRYLERHGFIDDEVKDMCIEALGNDTNVGSKWIPCSERLPKDNQEVLIFADGNIEIDTYYDGEFEACCFYGNEVIAWQPLPEPYKGE